MSRYLVVGPMPAAGDADALSVLLRRRRVLHAAILELAGRLDQINGIIEDKLAQRGLREETSR